MPACLCVCARTHSLTHSYKYLSPCVQLLLPMQGILAAYSSASRMSFTFLEKLIAETLVLKGVAKIPILIVALKAGSCLIARHDSTY